MKHCLRSLLVCLFLVPAAAATASEALEQAVAARQAYEAGKWDEARELYSRLAEQFPDDAELRFRLGNVHTRLGRLDEAVAIYKGLIESQPASPKAWHNLALIRLHQGMDALSEAAQRGSAQEGGSSRRLLEMLDAAIEGRAATAPDSPAAPPPPRVLVAFAAARLNLREGCGAHHSVRAVVAANARVDVLVREGACAQVRTETGETGWLPQSFLRLAPVADDKHGS